MYGPNTSPNLLFCKIVVFIFIIFCKIDNFILNQPQYYQTAYTSILKDNIKKKAYSICWLKAQDSKESFDIAIT